MTSKIIRVAIITTILFIVLYIFNALFFKVQDRIKCYFSNGKWNYTGGVAAVKECIYTYKDGGKPCKSSRECEGGCIVTKKEQQLGKCRADSRRVGSCYAIIEEKERGILCVD